MNTAALSPQRRRYSNENFSNNNNVNTSAIMEGGNDHQCLIDHEHDEIASTHSNSSGKVVDTIVNAAQVCNSLVSEYCGLCTFYIDKQVQYELISHAAREPVIDSSTFESQDYFGSTRRNVAAAALQMFDEESVVESVTSR